MKFHDSIIGAMLIICGLWVVWTASGFPRLTGQPIGPGTFPVVLGSLCVLGGIGIGVQGLLSGGALAQISPHWRRPDRIASVIVVVAGTALLAATFETVGFPLGGSLLLVALFVTSGKRHPAYIALAIGFVVTVHLVMSRLLQVPIPAGVLKGIF
ncbi:tripartite tricarboxylate transporter TctB family protein [Roseicitreum antarcticum]|uniref:Tripartite tricarboxylate transporter TctB family protein n=1 Tax=Roseicitreum antarcticum TaxID=564137 RepID=A0A1H2VHK4_9RHOB|nr:tripartite tricarboxylate transporter TctB family protein [Roseicitreum antarcticum]SDW67826.1 Tripartite tricarboxylate transporter TctB family protein [Roseicitreum antarcticum]